MKITFTVIDEGNKEHKSEPINGFESWKHAALGAVIYAHQMALKLDESIKLKSIQRIDV